MKHPGRTFALVVMCAMVGSSLAARNEPLWSAARQGNLEEVQAALAAGTEVDARAEDGATALFYAARYGHAEVVEFLAARGANLNVVASIEVGDRTYDVTALGAAALGGYDDIARTLLKGGAAPPEFLLFSEFLLPFSFDFLDKQQDWEVIASIVRTPEVEVITQEILLQDAVGVYRSHDGQQYEVRGQDRMLELAAADGSVVGLQFVGGTTFAQSLQPGPAPEAVVESQRRTDRNVAILTQWLQRLPPEERDALVEQYLERRGVWLDFTIGEDQVLGFSVRDGGPRGPGGIPLVFLKLDTRPDVWPSAERDVVSTSPSVAPSNWPSFRGPHASGVADRQFPPTAWQAEPAVNIRWKTPIPGLGNSSPVVWGDRIFITTAISSDPNPLFGPGNLGEYVPALDRAEYVWKIYSVDKRTGELLWERTAYQGVPKGGRHIKSTFANATPATDGEHVVAFFGPEGLYCYDMEGTLIWQTDLGFVGDPDYGFGSSPIIYRDMVIVLADSRAPQGETSSSSFIAAFDLADGSERWRTPREERASSFGTPTLYEGRAGPQLITNGGERIRAYDPMTGDELWSFSAGTIIVTPTPVVGNDLVFLTSGFRPLQPIYAIRLDARGDISLKEGEEVNEFVAWSKQRGGSYMSTPIVYGEYFYVVNISGILACYDAQTGERMYRARLRHMGGGITSSPVAADGRLYFSSEDGDVFVVKAGPEFELLATNSLGEVILATPAISDGMIFIRTLHHLFGIG